MKNTETCTSNPWQCLRDKLKHLRGHVFSESTTIARGDEMYEDPSRSCVSSVDIISMVKVIDKDDDCWSCVATTDSDKCTSIELENVSKNYLLLMSLTDASRTLVVRSNGETSSEGSFSPDDGEYLALGCDPARVMGSVSSAEYLPKDGNRHGDVWFVVGEDEETTVRFVWIAKNSTPGMVGFGHKFVHTHATPRDFASKVSDCEWVSDVLKRIIPAQGRHREVEEAIASMK